MVLQLIVDSLLDDQSPVHRGHYRANSRPYEYKASVVASPLACILMVLLLTERSTPVGKVIGEYLTRSKDLSDEAIHLLFTANRWELVYVAWPPMSPFLPS